MPQADADLVWCNDYDTRNNLALLLSLLLLLAYLYVAGQCRPGVVQ
jgi:hypothetical protein